ncbi:hypothetical protein EDD99_0017 [Streptomyces sp. 846.5]|nr:hypothetical protein [Streptomyces sp. 846.5]TDU01656.1 hypothetical protein EDD99_0017 [Streptomyces sp. 846.5]
MDSLQDTPARVEALSGLSRFQWPQAWVSDGHPTTAHLGISTTIDSVIWVFVPVPVVFVQVWIGDQFHWVLVRLTGSLGVWVST